MQTKKVSTRAGQSQYDPVYLSAQCLRTRDIPRPRARSSAASATEAGRLERTRIDPEANNVSVRLYSLARRAPGEAAHTRITSPPLRCGGGSGGGRDGAPAAAGRAGRRVGALGRLRLLLRRQPLRPNGRYRTLVPAPLCLLA